MAIPNNYIDKITDKDKNESRLICPAAENVRVENENFEADNLDEVLDELADTIDDAGQVDEIIMNGQHYTPTNKVIDLGTVITQHQDISGKADKATTYTKTETDNAIANAVEGLGGGSVESVTINGQTKTPDSQGNVDLGNVQGEQGPKGDTGNVQVDGNGNVLIVNNLEEGGTGAALSAEMGKRLAMLSGTFAAAWAHSKAVPTTFCWLWQETVDGDAICKPIWHIGNSVFVDAVGAVVNVDAPQSVPAPPTMTINGSTATSGGSYGKNAELVITPAANSALYWRIGSGSYNVSDTTVTVTLPSGSLAIEAYCTNQAGNSQTASVNVTVAGTATPSFAAATGTTINDGVVSRGGSVVVSVPQGGELHYRINGGNWTTASGLSVTIPIATNLSQGEMSIEAYNVEDGDESTHVTNTYTMDALAAPSFSVADNTEFPASGGSVELSAATGAGIYYNLTTDGTDPADPTDASTQYSGTPISVSVATKIKAIAKDSYGSSAVSSASYTVKEAGISIKTNAATTMTLTNTDDTTIEKSLISGDNFFGFTELGGSSFKTVVFGDKAALLEIDFGGASFIVFGGSTYSNAPLGYADNLTRLVGLVLNGNAAGATAQRALNLCRSLSDVQVSGVINNAATMCDLLGNKVSKENVIIDFSGITSVTGGVAGMFSSLNAETLDVSSIDFSNSGSCMNLFNNTKVETLIIGSGFSFVVTGSLGNYPMFNSAAIATIKCVGTTPPSLTGYDWIADWVDNGTATTKTIQVPAGSLTTYQTAFGHVNDVTWVEY